MDTMIPSINQYIMQLDQHRLFMSDMLKRSLFENITSFGFWYLTCHSFIKNS